MNPLQALLNRAREEAGAIRDDTLPNPLAPFVRGAPAQVHYNPLRKVPVVGGLINTTINGPLHSVGLINEAAGNVAQGVTGEGLLALAAIVDAARKASGPDTPETPASRLAQDILAQGPMHPGRIVEAARHFDNPLISWPTGAIEMLANPLNFAGPIGEGGAAIEAAGKFPAAGRAIQQAAHVLDATNRVQGLPFAVTARGRQALLPEVFGKAATAAEEVLGSQAAKEVLDRPPAPPPVDLEALAGVRRSWDDFGLAPNPADYRGYAKRQGLPMPAALPKEASPLAPESFSIFRAAKALPLRERQALQAPLRAAAEAVPEVPEITPPKAGPQWTTYGPETIHPGEDVTPELLDQFAKLRPESGQLDIESEIGALRDPVTLLQQAYGDQWQNRLAALTGGKWGQPGSGARMVNGRMMLGDLDITTALRDYLENRGGDRADEFKGALKGLLPGKVAPAVSAIADKVAGVTRIFDGGDRYEFLNAPRTSPLSPPAPKTGMTSLYEKPKVGERVYRGVTPDEAADIAANGRIQSRGDYSLQGEGTNFANDFETAEDYVNYGRDDPRTTGRPNYVIEATSNPEMRIDRDGYVKTPGAVPLERITRVWRFNPDGSVDASTSLAPLVGGGESAAARFTGTIDDLRAFLAGGDNGNLGAYPPNDPAFYQKRLNIDPGQVPGMLRKLVGEGVLGELPDGGLAIRPARATKAPPLSAIADKVAPEIAAAAEPTMSLAEAIAAHRGLPGDRRAAALGDIYRELGAPKEVKGIGRTGEEIIGYAYSPDLFIKSDATGAPIRHFVTLPNGMRVHPDELRRATITPEGAVRFAPPVAAKVKVGSGRARGVADLQGLMVETLLPGVNSPQRAAAEARPVTITLDDGSVVQTTAGAVQAAGKRLGGGLPINTFVADHLDTGAAFEGGDLAAGGGGFGVLPFPGGLPQLERTLTGAAAGGLAGLAGGALAPADSVEDRARNIFTGGAIGLTAGGSVGAAAPQLRQAAQQIAPAVAAKFSDDSLRNPEVWVDALAYGAKQQVESLGSAGVRPSEAWGAFWRRWGSQAVLTMKQMPQDALTRLVTLKGVAGPEFGIGEREIVAHQGEAREVLMGRLAPEDDSVGRWITDLGLPQLHKVREDLVGSTPAEALAGRGAEFKGVGRALSGALMGTATGLKTFNPLAPLYGAARHYFAPFMEGAIVFMNTMQHNGFRNAMLDAGLSRDMPRVGDAFLQSLQQRGFNTAPLQGRGGRFSAQEVAQIAGQQAGDDWAMLAEATMRGLGDRAAKLAGDFRDKAAKGYTGKVTTGDKVVGTIERGLGRVSPFSRWTVRYTPVLAEIAARHPRAAMLALGEVAREGGEGVTIDDETPLVGLAARARHGGGKGTLSIKPLQSLIPYTNIADRTRLEPGEDQTGFQRVAGALDQIGFGLGPVPQAIAYATGQDYKAPGALSRTAPLEALADALPPLARAALRNTGHEGLANAVPDMPQLPGPRAALDRVREIVTGGSAPNATDPAERRYAELVLQATGKPISDKSNLHYLETVGHADNGLWQLALVQSRLGGAVGNVTSMTSPVQVTGRTDEANAARRAGKLPITDYEISQAPKSQQPQLRAALALAIARDPAAATYRNISGGSRERALMEQWEKENQFLKRAAPALYAERRKAYAAAISR